MRCAHIDEPARKILRIEVSGLNRQRNRPHALEAVAFPLKQLAISLRTTRLITGDVDDMPSPHGADAGLASCFRPLAKRQIHAAILDDWHFDLMSELRQATLPLPRP